MIDFDVVVIVLFDFGEDYVVFGGGVDWCVDWFVEVEFGVECGVVVEWIGVIVEV